MCFAFCTFCRKYSNWSVKSNKKQQTTSNMTEMRVNQTKTILDLPEELLEQILSHISPYGDFKCARLVCKLWHRVLQGIEEQELGRFDRSLVGGGIEWSVRNSSVGSTISERFLHSCVYFDKSIYVFGGCTSTNTTFNDLWRFDLRHREWHRPIASGTYPPPKACSSFVEHDGRLVLFGGWSHATPYPLHQPARFFSQVHTFCPESIHWTQIESSGSGESPPGTAGHSAAVIRNAMIVIGGSHNQGHSCIDIWVLNLLDMTWRKKQISGVKPLPRYGHSQVVVDQQHILTLGGCGGPNMQFNDVWMLKMGETEWTWQEINISGKLYSPPQLWYHPACKVGDNIVVLSKLSSKSPRASLVPTAILQKIQLGKLCTTSKACARSANDIQDTRQVPKRRLPETSESSSQDSSSDSEEVLGASGSGRGQVTSEPQPGPSNRGVGASSAQHAAAAPRSGMPSIRPNAMRNRQRQLEALKRYEDRIKRQLHHQQQDLQQNAQPQQRGVAAASAALSSDESDGEFVPSCLQQRTVHPMYVHTLDISKAVDEGLVTWLPVEDDAHGQAPEETILYSLVCGRGELIMFGGMETDAKSMQIGLNIQPQVVSNKMRFIKPPYRYR